jgi:hypothetical protein
MLPGMSRKNRHGFRINHNILKRLAADVMRQGHFGGSVSVIFD